MVPMSQIKIEVTGVSYAEARELAGLLEQVEGVESTRVPWKTRDHALDPNTLGRVVIPEIRASVEAFTLVITLAGAVVIIPFVRGFAEGFGKGFGEEAGKDAYPVVKNRLLSRYGEWLASKEPERRKRITLVFDDEHMLVNKGETDD